MVIIFTAIPAELRPIVQKQARKLQCVYRHFHSLEELIDQGQQLAADEVLVLPERKIRKATLFYPKAKLIAIYQSNPHFFPSLFQCLNSSRSRRRSFKMLNQIIDKSERLSPYDRRIHEKLISVSKQMLASGVRSKGQLLKQVRSQIHRYNRSKGY